MSSRARCLMLLVAAMVSAASRAGASPLKWTVMKVTMEQRSGHVGASPYSAGRMKGIAAFTSFRGYALNDAVFEEETSRIYSGETGHFLLRSRRLMIAFEAEGGDPDFPIDCDLAIQAVAKSIEAL